MWYALIILTDSFLLLRVISVDSASLRWIAPSRFFSQTFNLQLLTFDPPSPLSPLDATLMHTPASVANKRLTPWLNPLDATLTKKRGRGPDYG